KEYGERHRDHAGNLPVDDLAAKLADVDALVAGDRNRPIVLYCRSGGRAARAKALLVEAGFRQVTNLGGIDDWTRP
ncbi:MAG: rhodanese-like domain-containing protein, partial [Myxococcales bacterium]|nr:rhodanese-like domain-containing protein [Myxococcales bacterium]